MTADQLKEFALLEGLSGSDRSELAEVLEPLELPAGFVVYEEGDAAGGLLLVAEGRVSLCSARAAGCVEYGPGSVLGVLSLVAGGVREATARTASHSRLWLLRRDAVERLIERAPRTACRLLQAVLHESAGLLRAMAHASLVDRTATSD